MIKDRILSRLEEQKGRVVTGGSLAKELGVSRTAVWKVVHALKEEGALIQALPNRGYRLEEESDLLSPTEIGRRLATGCLGRELEVLGEVDSTNGYLRRLDASTLPEGYAVLADGQTGGRGRMGRAFASPQGQGIYLSVLLRPAIPLEEVPFLTICGAVAVCRAVEDLCGFRPGIKWVNDLYWEGKKLCGILTEAALSAEAGRMDCCVMGIGLNTGEVDPQVGGIATSVWQVTGRRGLRNRLAAQILNRLEETCQAYVSQGKKGEILAAYTQRMLFLGERVTMVLGEEALEATLLGVEESGGLAVRLESGERRVFSSGDVRLRPRSGGAQG